MSKNSPKQQHAQLVDWLASRTTNKAKKPGQREKRFSKAEVYKQANNYGKRSN